MTIAQNKQIVIDFCTWFQRLVGEESPCKDWRPVIAGMGVNGWELTTIIQTPYLAQSTFTVYTMKLLMIFQRRIIPDHQRQIHATIQRAAEENLEKERKKLGATLHPEVANVGINKKKTPSPRRTKRYVYADDAVLSENVGNGSVRTGTGVPLVTTPRNAGYTWH